MKNYHQNQTEGGNSGSPIVAILEVVNRQVSGPTVDNFVNRSGWLSSKGQAEVAVYRHGLLVLMELQLIRG